MTVGFGSLLEAAGSLKTHAEQHPLDYQVWTHPQDRFLHNRSKRRLLRTGNRVGKSYASIADVAMRALGGHPFRPDWRWRGRTDQLILCYSWSQSVPLQAYLRQFLPPHRIKFQPGWRDDKGWGKDAPTIILDDGSTICFRTANQGPLALSGSEYDHVLIDEPCGSTHYRELNKRVMSRGGEITLSLTPVNAPEPLDWLRELCEKGTIEDIHIMMTQDAFTLTDGRVRTLIDGTVCDDLWIAEQRADTMEMWRPVVCDGEWEAMALDAMFGSVFHESKHVSTQVPAGDLYISLGLDHGTQAFTETAVLIAVDETGDLPVVHIIDEYEAQENSPPERDAREIINMLSRHGIAWRNGSLDFACGDIVHYGGGRNIVGRKSNKALSAELVKVLKLPRHAALSPPIRTAKTGKGSDPRKSLYLGCTWIHKQLRRGNIKIHPRCTSLIQSFKRYRGGSRDPHGHVMDALRYALTPWSIRRRRTRPVTKIRRG